MASGQTTNYDIPYPLPTDPVDVASDMQGLAERVDTLINTVPPTIIENAQTSSYNLQSTDNGKFINITTGGVTVNVGVFEAGQNAVIYNNSATSQTITQGASVTLRFAGTTTTGNRTLASYGVATILCVSTNVYVIAGTGLT